jgi:DNA gyrase/topoisomerase IV subunit A
LYFINPPQAFPILVTITDRGYVKRLSHVTYQAQRRGGRGITGIGLREEDRVAHILSANTHDRLLFFTNRGRVFQIKVHELPETGRVRAEAVGAVAKDLRTRGVSESRILAELDDAAERLGVPSEATDLARGPGS